MKKRIQIAENSLSKIVRTLSADYNIDVIFRSGASPCTIDNKILLPSIPEDASKELINVTGAFADHESAHIMYTDAYYRKSENMDRMFSDKQVEKFVLNALEDIRIENRLKKIWPGCTRNLRSMMDYMFKKFASPSESDPSKSNWEATGNLFKTLISFYIYESISRDDSNDFWVNYVPHEIRQCVLDNIDIIDRTIAADTTEAAHDIARELMVRLNLSEFEEKKDNSGSSKNGAKPSDSQNKSNSKDGGQSSQDSSDGSDSSDDTGNGSGDSDDSDDSEDEDSDSSSDNQDDSDDSQESQNSSGDQDSDDSSDSENASDSEQNGDNTVETQLNTEIVNSDGSKIQINETRKQIQEDESNCSIQEQLAKDAQNSYKESSEPYHIFSTESDKIVRIEPSKNDRSKFHNLERSTSNVSKVIKRKLARALLTNTYSRWETDKSRGKINRRVLHRLVNGTSNRIFKQKGEDIYYDTAVMLAVDHSGSMSGDKAKVAMQTAILLGDVLSQIDCSFSVVGFSTEDGYEGSQRFNAANETDRSIFSRWGSLWIGMYKDFSDIWAHKKFRVSQIDNNIRFNTYDGESVRFCARKLLERKEKRKILIWVNDGQPCPNGSDNFDVHNTFAKKVGAEIGNYIEMVAIGIQAPSIVDYYPNAININNANELGGVALNQLVKLLKPRYF